MIDFNHITSILTVGLGGIIIIFAAISTLNILKKTRISTYNIRWKILFFLMLFFLLGYGASLILILLKMQDVLNLLIGVVFLFGAMFVYLVVRTGYLTIDELISTSVSMEYVESIIESMEDFLLVSDAEGSISKCNPSLLKALGYTEQEILEKNIIDLFEELDQIQFTNLTERLKSNSSIRHLEYKIITGEDKKFHVLLSLSPLHNSDGSLQGIVFTAQNIEDLIKSKKDAEMARYEMDKILNNVSEGLFLLAKKDDDYVFSDHYSAVLEEILELKELAGLSFLLYLNKKIPESLFSSTRDYLEILFRDDVKDSFLVDLNPITECELIFPDDKGAFTRIKFLEFQFSRTRIDENITNIMVRVRDRTEEKKLAREVEKLKYNAVHNQELLFILLEQDSVLVEEFLREVLSQTEKISKRLEQTKKPEDYLDTLDYIFRSMHGIKGNANTLGLNNFADKAHTMEDIIEELKTKTDLTGMDFLPLTIGLNLFHDMVDTTDALVDKIIHFHAGHKEIGYTAAPSATSEGLKNSMRKSMDQLQQDLEQTVFFDDSEFDSRMIPDRYQKILKDIFNQLFRNSMIHGIETENDRIKSGKPITGKIKVSSKISGNKLIIDYRDDGRGIDTKELKNKSVKLGLLSDEEVSSLSEAQALKLIYLPGISTSKELNLHAGRGIGMDLIRQNVMDAGGKIQAFSSPGKYCKFSIELPL